MVVIIMMMMMMHSELNGMNRLRIVESMFESLFPKRFTGTVVLNFERGNKGERERVKYVGLI